MKRTNPETGRPFKAGDSRDDGMVFAQYKKLVKKDGYFAEGWVRPDVRKKHLVGRKKQARQIAIAQGKAHYFTGKPCIRGHFSKRNVTTRKCMACDREDKKQLKLSNPEKFITQRKADREKNRERLNAAKRLNNRKHAARIRLSNLERKQAVRQRTPAWLDLVDKAEMESIYTYCLALRSCGLDYHVDHIIPLQGKSVSGLHVPSNLQVLYSKDNIAKKNRWDND
jgi:hypothetical protein